MAQNLHNFGTKFAQFSHKICTIFTQNLHNFRTKFAQVSHKICTIFFEICPTFAPFSPKFPPPPAGSLPGWRGQRGMIFPGRELSRRTRSPPAALPEGWGNRNLKEKNGGGGGNFFNFPFFWLLNPSVHRLHTVQFDKICYREFKTFKTHFPF